VVVVMLLIMAGAAFFFHFLVSRHIQADYHFNMGEMVRRKDGRLEDAVWLFTRARNLAPYRGQVAYHEGFARYRVAELMVLDYQNARARGQTEKSKALLDQAIKQLNVTEQVLSQALETYHFKDIYFYRAKARSSLGLLAGNPQLLESAIRDFRRTIEIYPPDLPAYYELGKMYYTMRQTNKALDVWKAAQKYDYHYMNRFHIEDALYLEKSGLYETAMEYYRIAIMLDKDNPWYYQKLFELSKKTGDLKEAVRLGKVYLDLFPNDYGAIMDLAKIHNKLGNEEAVEEWLEWFLAVEPPTTESVISAVACLEMLDRQGEAADLIKEWYERNREAAFFIQEEFKLLEKLDVLLSQQGKDEERIQLWDSVLGLPDDNLPPLYRSISRFYQARVSVHRGQFSAAWKALEQAHETPVEPEMNTHVQGSSMELFWMGELPLLF
jgi:tetratricopeptide (TPR) repeat protein